MGTDRRMGTGVGILVVFQKQLLLNEIFGVTYTAYSYIYLQRVGV